MLTLTQIKQVYADVAATPAGDQVVRESGAATLREVVVQVVQSVEETLGATKPPARGHQRATSRS